MKSFVPEGAEDLGAVYTNFNHRLDEKVASELERRSGETFAQHAAWNFSGRVWHDKDGWHNEVWRYGSPQLGIDGSSVLDVINEANEQFGFD